MMTSKLLAAALALAAPLAAPAQDLFLGLRIGWAWPFGNIAPNDAIRDVVSSQIPNQLDAGYRFGERWSAGGYFSYAFGRLASEADAACGAADCSANDIRFGIQGAVHYAVRPEREAWGGLLLGLERLDLDAPGTLETTALGWEWGIQGGLDFASSSAGFGPFLSLTWGRFWDLDRGGNDVSLPDQEIHTTFQLGVRGWFEL